MSQARRVSTSSSILGENPLWNAVTGQLLWVDCMGRRLLSLDPTSGREEERPLKRTPGSFVFRKSGGIFMANRQGLAFLDCDSGMLEDVAAHAIDFSRAVLNDGKCDSRGRFWVGSMDREIAAPSGALYRVDPDLSVTMMDEGLTLSNGIAWSPDERTMLFCDSRPGRIWAYDYEIADGSISNRRVFVDFEGRKGRPDGCTIDADGGLWVAEIGAGQVVRFDPSGRQDVAIPVPTSRPTSVTFGGHDLRTLYVTSMRHGLSDEEVACQPDAGHVFAIDLDVSGLAAALFAG